MVRKVCERVERMLFLILFLVKGFWERELDVLELIVDFLKLVDYCFFEFGFFVKWEW